MDRRRFLASSAGAAAVAVGGQWVAVAGAATDEELAYANFCISGELLARDFYARALGARKPTPRATVLRQGRVSATRHVEALGQLLTGAGETAPVAEDFEFVWPRRAFTTTASTVTTGVTILRPLLGAYVAAAASVSLPSYRVLYVSLAAATGGQLGALAGPAAVESFPVAVDLETASAALEPYLG